VNRLRALGSATWRSRQETIVAYNAVYACVTLIASDIAKMAVRLVEQDKNGIWNEVNVFGLLSGVAQAKPISEPHQVH
jgi:phage portal protein BeeE